MSVDTLEAPATEQVVEQYEFSGNDRCDADKGVQGYRGVLVAEQAYHRWTKGESEIFLCNHHNQKQAPNLVANGWAVESSPLYESLGNPLDVSA